MFYSPEKATLIGIIDRSGIPKDESREAYKRFDHARSISDLVVGVALGARRLDKLEASDIKDDKVLYELYAQPPLTTPGDAAHLAAVIVNGLETARTRLGLDPSEMDTFTPVTDVATE